MNVGEIRRSTQVRSAGGVETVSPIERASQQDETFSASDGIPSELNSERRTRRSQ
jgi:hypothetical protein